MNKTSLYAILLAALVPLASYLIVKKYSESAIEMPKHYFADTVINQTRQGKEYSDTVWHRLADFSLTNQQNATVTWDNLKGKVIIADFFFTHCPNICPAMTSNMKRLETAITNSQRVGDKTPDFLHFLSFSIDPERDSVERLKYWANRFQINPQQWWLLTGEKKAIYNMAINEMKLGLVDGEGIDTNFFHSDYFVLIDSTRRVRGYYHGLDTMDLKKLANDIIFLTMEKGPHGKSPLAGQFQIVAIAFLSAIIGVGLLIFIIKKKGKDVSTSMGKK